MSPTTETAITGPRLPRREAWVDVPEYEGFRVRLWTNYPRRVLDQLASQEPEEVLTALRTVVLEHNGWLDFDGQPFPPASEALFWEQIPDELAGALLVMARLEAGKLAIALIPKRKAA